MALATIESEVNMDVTVKKGEHQRLAHSDFLSVYGIATISTDKKLIEELWEAILKT